MKPYTFEKSENQLSNQFININMCFKTHLKDIYILQRSPFTLEEKPTYILVSTLKGKRGHVTLSNKLFESESNTISIINEFNEYIKK